MARPALKQFDTEQDLTDFANQLNDAGMAPEIPIMDSSGICAFARLQAPGGDGWGFAYYTVNDPDVGAIVGDEDGWVKPARYLDGYPAEDEKQPGWKPTWPVYGIVAALT